MITVGLRCEQSRSVAVESGGGAHHPALLPDPRRESRLRVEGGLLVQKSVGERLFVLLPERGAGDLTRHKDESQSMDKSD